MACLPIPSSELANRAYWASKLFALTAWTYNRTAGERAARVYANADAARFYERAITAGRKVRASIEERVAVYQDLSGALTLLGRFDDSDATLGEARQLLKGEFLEAAPIVIAQAILPSRQGRYRQTTLRVNSALRRLEQAPAV